MNLGKISGSKQFSTTIGKLRILILFLFFFRAIVLRSLVIENFQSYSISIGQSQLKWLILTLTSIEISTID